VKNPKFPDELFTFCVNRITKVSDVVCCYLFESPREIQIARESILSWSSLILLEVEVTKPLHEMTEPPDKIEVNRFLTIPPIYFMLPDAPDVCRSSTGSG